MAAASTSELTHLRVRVKQLVDELGEMRKLVTAMWEHIEKADEQIERSNEIIRRRIEDFEMMLADKGGEWRDGLIGRYNDLANDYNRLVKKWNRHVVSLKGSPTIGRPLQASEAQQAQAWKLRKAGGTLRDIARETNLSIQSIRTIISRQKGASRPNNKRSELRKTKLSCQRPVSWRPGERTRDALADQIKVLQGGEELLKDGRDLLKRK
jgi:hypothetical protein